MATAKTLEDLFVETLKDAYSAEKQILKALPKMSKAAESEELTRAFEKHRDETEGHVERLEQVFELVGKPARAKTCQAIQGIIEEANEIAHDFKGSDALDAGILAAAQAVEHYEITRSEDGAGPAVPSYADEPRWGDGPPHGGRPEWDARR